MNAVLYFNDGNGEFDIVDLNIKQEFYPCCGLEEIRLIKLMPMLPQWETITMMDMMI